MGNNKKTEFLKDILTGLAINTVYDTLKSHSIFIGTFVALFVASLSPSLVKVSPLKMGIVAGFIFFFMRIGYHVSKWGISTYKIRSKSGLFYFRQNESDRDKTKNIEFLQEKIRNARGIEIIGATGFNTFARNDATGKAILREILEQTTGEIKILLLHPNKPQTEIRAKSIGMPLDEYKQEIHLSIRFLKELYQRGKNVTLKFYEQKPIWKMIFVDNFLWLQHYYPGQHVEEMSVYGIARSPEKNKSNLFDAFYTVFQKKWQHDGNPTYDFKLDKLRYDDGSTESMESKKKNRKNKKK